MNEINGVNLALSEASRKAEKGMLINCNDANSQERMDNWDWNKGDFETVYSIESLYSDLFPTQSKEIASALMQRYPSHY